MTRSRLDIQKTGPGQTFGEVGQFRGVHALAASLASGAFGSLFRASAKVS